MGTRTTTDIIIDLEKDVKEIKLLIQNMEFLLKNAVSKIDKNAKLNDLKDQKEESFVEDFVSQKESNEKNSSVVKMPGLKEGIFVNANQVGKKVQTDFTKELNALNKPGGRSRVLIPVQQKVVYKNGTPVTMASVELLRNSNGSLESIKKIKTNATGKWTHNLPAGDYVLKVFKNRNFNNNEVNIECVISVPESNDPVLLDQVEANV